MTALASVPTPLGRSSHLLLLVERLLVASMLSVGLIRSLVGTGPTVGKVVVAGALAAWYGGGSGRVASWSSVRVHGWLAGLSVLLVAAVWVTPDFAWVSFAVFVVFANSLGLVPATVSIFVLAALTGTMLLGRWPDTGHWSARLIGPMVGAGVAGALVGITRLAAAEAAERQRLLDDLVAARDDLARAQLDAGARVERERLSREIHDTLAQGFTSVVLGTRRARRAVRHNDLAAACEEIDHLEALGRSGVEDARRLIGQLPPAELDDRTLPAALESLAMPGGPDGTPPIDVRIDGEPRSLPPGTDVALLRVAQEALTNARRHAAADRIVITLTFQPGMARLDIADDGIGFDPRRPSGGHGLTGMARRIEQVDGTLVIEAAPKMGTVVAATVPTNGSEPG